MAYTSDPQSTADLLAPLTVSDAKALLSAYLAVPQNKVSNWLSGAVYRTMLEMEALIASDFRAAHQALLANGYPGSAVGESLTRVARGWYGRARELARCSVQSVTIACDATHGPYTAAQVAGLVGLSTDGKRYLVTTSGSVSSPGVTTVVMTAESPGAARGLVASVGTTLAGVTWQGTTVSDLGADEEGDASVDAAIAAAWPDMSVVPPQDRVVFWALRAAPPPAVTRVKLDADPAVPGGVVLTLAKAGGGASGGDVTLVSNALAKYSPITDYNTAQAATNRTVTTSGTVRVALALAARAKAAAAAAWTAYLDSDEIAGTVFLEKLHQVVGDAIRADPGSNFTGAALSGAAGDGNVYLGSTEVPVGGDLGTELTWVTY